jgi:hypothetical protein
MELRDCGKLQSHSSLNFPYVIVGSVKCRGTLKRSSHIVCTQYVNKDSRGPTALITAVLAPSG